MESYDSILNRMRAKFKDKAGFSADDASDVGIRLEVLAGEIFSVMSNIEWLKREMFPQTASGVQLDKHARQRGLKRKGAIKSKGKLKFTMKEKSERDVIVPEGTVCATSGENSIRFITLEDAVISAGNLYVEVDAQSEKAGRDSNTNAQTINIIVTQLQSVDSVINMDAFAGGLDEETDEELRKRLIENYRNVSNGTNVAFYKNFVLKYDGVNTASVAKMARGVGTIDIYVSGRGTSIDIDKISQMQSDINKAKEINVDVKVLNAELVTVDVELSIEVQVGYDKETVKNLCKQAIRNYFLSLGIGDTVYLAAISDVVYHTEGVKNYQFTSGHDADIVMTNGKQAICGTITITDMQEE